MSEELRTAVETDYWEFVDYEDADISSVSDAYMDYISSENYYD